MRCRTARYQVDEHTQNATLVKQPADAEIEAKCKEKDGGKAWLMKELRRRGFLKPPYAIFAHEKALFVGGPGRLGAAKRP